MNTVFVSGFSGEGYKEYGKALIDSFVANNDEGYALHLFTHDMGGLPSYPMVWQFEQDIIQGLYTFLQRHKNNLVAHGKEATNKWNVRQIQKGYSYKFDAYKFCRMVFTMWAAGVRLANDGVRYMVWLDGDTKIRQQIPSHIAERSLPSGEAYAYIGRGQKHTETGYLVFDLEKALPILHKWSGYYRDDSFKMEKEWHSAYLFDRARECFPDIKGHDLTPGLGGHAMTQCWVGEIFEHNKGERRKRMGRSPETKPLGTYKIPEVSRV